MHDYYFFKIIDNYFTPFFSYFGLVYNIISFCKFNNAKQNFKS